MNGRNMSLSFKKTNAVYTIENKIIYPHDRYESFILLIFLLIIPRRLVIFTVLSNSFSLIALVCSGSYYFYAIKIINDLYYITQ